MCHQNKDIWITRASIAMTVGIVLGLLHFLAKQAEQAFLFHQSRLIFEVLAFAAAVLFLIYGNLLYQFCRLGCYQRRQNHKPASRDVLERFYECEAPSLTVLIPSYKEEQNIIWQAMVSAALTEYPEKSVVLLIDDPYEPSSAEDSLKLSETRSIPMRLQDLFRAPVERYQSELTAFRNRTKVDGVAELRRLRQCYREVSAWLEKCALEFVKEKRGTALPHTEEFFVENVLRAPARRHAAFADELEKRAQLKEGPSREFLERQYRRLVGFFNVRFSSFERKRYRNLSHAANKAMNLNSYVSLMGKGWREVGDSGGCRLQEVTPNNADFLIPSPDYLITLDADSLLLSDYALRLIQIMEHPKNRKLAVIQTPYSAFPGSPNLLERIAGATTDLQYISHQGFTRWNATFWVGANALVRRSALEDIKQIRSENEVPVSVYIQDRTVIEDTESSIDLIGRGWKLVNYPERLAYSATPPDFGALLIQRRRWANGGLLILPKLLRYAASTPKRSALLKEFFIRLHYLTSLAGVSVATLLVFFYPFKDRFAIFWLPLTAAPYYFLYARDLRHAGYRCSDVLRVYALNLILIPVVLGGVLKSLQQGITGSKIPFGRTPKVSGRTAAPPLYCFLELSFPLVFMATFCWDISSHHWSRALFALLNGLLFLYALVRMLGLRETAYDLVGSWRVTEPRLTELCDAEP
jgi:cellulose synthase (UDP-forming)